MKSKRVKNVARAMRRKIEQALAWAGDTGKPYLTERDGILSLHFDEYSVQSEMYIDRPDELVIGYTRAMMSFLLLEPDPARIGMIGLGGGSLAKYCYRHLPEAQISVVEINPDVIALRNEFAVPPDDERFCVLEGDGAAWVAKAQALSVLILDGFDAAGLPEQLSCRKFYDDCYGALTHEGILVVNLWGGYAHFDEYVERISSCFSGRLVIVDASDSVNKIVLAVKSDDFPPASSTIRHHANTLDASHTVNFREKSNRLIRALNRINSF